MHGAWSTVDRGRLEKSKQIDAVCRIVNSIDNLHTQKGCGAERSRTQQGASIVSAGGVDVDSLTIYIVVRKR
jgi:hypothetical protein